MRPPAALLDQLSRSKLMISRARPTGGVGERRSSTKGAGMEFADHRPYQPGDDVRHLDPHLYARHGSHYIRQYSVDRQLRITVLVDASASMLYGEPDKFAFAQALAGAFGFVGLAAGDLVEVGMLGDERERWSPRVMGTARADVMLGWIESQAAGGKVAFTDGVRQVLPKLPAGSLVVLISDWWMEDPAASLKSLDGFDGEFLALQVVSPEEDEPARIGDGPLRLLDSESGDEMELVLGPDTVNAYVAAVAEFRETLKAEFRKRRGRFFALRTDADLTAFFTRTLRGAEVIS